MGVRTYADWVTSIKCLIAPSSQGMHSMENQQATFTRLADLIDRMEALNERLNKLQLSIEAHLRRN